MKSAACLAIVLTIALFSTAGAQPPGRGDGPGGLIRGEKPASGDTRVLLEQVLAARLAAELQLSDEATVRMLKKVREYRDKLSELSAQRSEHTKALRQALAEEDDNAIEANLTKILDIDEQFSAVRRKLFEDSKSELTPKQRAKIFLFLHDFDIDIRRLIEVARNRGAGRTERFEASPESESPRAEERRKDGARQ